MKELSTPPIPLDIFDASAPSPIFSEKGVYCLIFKNRECTLSVGKKGDFSFKPGFHTYVGSALGPGGLKRVLRHIKLSGNRDKKPKWHVDYLHLGPSFSLVCVICAPTSGRFECTLASEIGGESVSGFGCTDCKCKSHLFYRAENPYGEIVKAFTACGLLPSGFICQNPEQ
ncbi:MAG: DUF123 domain-containing protein [Methanosarcinaceae archaeon]|nr:DUF123 domain-containing protein [Methanosarcinaceae archaeon]